MRAAAFLILAFLAGSVLAAEGQSELLGRLDSPNPAVRVDAVDALAVYREPQVLIALLLALRDHESEVRAHAAEALRSGRWG